jgi:multicomponent Na+:H+ antiporter subunit D
MSANLLPLLVAIPLLGAAVSAIANRSLTVQRVIGLASVAAVSVLSILTWLEVDQGSELVAEVGGWARGVGISLVVDRFSALVLMAASLIVLGVLIYSISQLGRDVLDWWFHPKYLALMAGVALSLSTGDLFNLFVGFELMLIASYTLLTVRSGARQVRSTMSYVVVNLVASVLFLVAISVAYSATGTLDMAQIAERLGTESPQVLALLSALTLVVFGIKAALFPLYMWLPDSYPTAPSPVTALFAGLLTKVGVYAIYRTQTLMFDSESGLLLGVAAATMFFGVVGAMAQRDVKRILSFHVISQIGYMIMGLGLFSVIGVAAGIAYIVNQIVVKTGLFLVAGEIEAENGGADLDDGSGLITTRPWLAASFAALALSLAGFPPLGGFVVKFALVQEGLSLGQWGVVAVALLVSLLTLFSMMKIWTGIFWGESSAPGTGARRGMKVITGSVAVLSLAIALVASDLIAASVRAAETLLAATGAGL